MCLSQPQEQFNDGRDALLVMSSAYYYRTYLWSADIFTSVWQENLYLFNFKVLERTFLWKVWQIELKSGFHVNFGAQSQE